MWKYYIVLIYFRKLYHEGVVFKQCQVLRLRIHQIAYREKLYNIVGKYDLLNYMYLRIVFNEITKRLILFIPYVTIWIRTSIFLRFSILRLQIKITLLKSFLFHFSFFLFLFFLFQHSNAKLEIIIGNISKVSFTNEIF